MPTLLRYETGLAEARAELQELIDEFEAADTPTDEQRAEVDAAIEKLKAAQRDLERARVAEAELEEARRNSPLYQQAVRAMPSGPDPQAQAEADALRALSEAARSKLTGQPMPSEAADVFAAHGAESPFDGQGGIVVPESLLELAMRAATATGNVVSHQPLTGGRIFGFIRPMSAMSSLGLAWQPVAAGKPKYGYVNESPDGSVEAEQPSLTPMTVDAATMFEQDPAPIRIAAKRGVTVEAEATLSELGQVITQDAYGAEREASEVAVFNGNAAPAIDGINARSEVARAVPAGGSVDTFATVVTAVESLVDGIYAGTVADLRLLVSPGLHAFLTTLRVTDNSTESAASYLMRVCASYMVSTYAPASAANGQTHNLLVRRGMFDGAAILPTWGTRLYEDTQTAAGVGRKLFVVRLGNVFVPQSASGQGGRADWKRIGIRSDTP